MESASGLNLVLGIGVHAANCGYKLLTCSLAESTIGLENLHFPLHNESQNWLKFLPSPGSRHARPVMAIGTVGLLLLFVIFATLNKNLYV